MSEFLSRELTKEERREVRETCAPRKYSPSPEKPESMELCFVRPATSSFIQAYPREAETESPLSYNQNEAKSFTEDAAVLGRHTVRPTIHHRASAKVLDSAEENSSTFYQRSRKQCRRRGRRRNHSAPLPLNSHWQNWVSFAAPDSPTLYIRKNSPPPSRTSKRYRSKFPRH